MSTNALPSLRGEGEGEKMPRRAASSSPLGHASRSAATAEGHVNTFVPMNPQNPHQSPSKIDRTMLLSITPVDTDKHLAGIIPPQEKDRLYEFKVLNAVRGNNDKGPKARTETSTDDTTPRTYARYHFPQVSVSSFGRLQHVGPKLKVQHYDVMVKWDYDDIRLNSEYGVYSPHFVRSFMTYERDDGKEQEEPNMFQEDLKKTWDFWAPAPLHKMDAVEIVEWVRNLRPRTLHDLKPLLMLCQGLLGDFLHNRLQTPVKIVQTQKVQYEMIISEVKAYYSDCVGRLKQALHDTLDWVEELRNRVGDTSTPRGNRRHLHEFLEEDYESPSPHQEDEDNPLQHKSQYARTRAENRELRRQVALLTAEQEKLHKELKKKHHELHEAESHLKDVKEQLQKNEQKMMMVNSLELGKSIIENWDPDLTSEQLKACIVELEPLQSSACIMALEATTGAKIFSLLEAGAIADYFDDKLPVIKKAELLEAMLEHVTDEATGAMASSLPSQALASICREMHLNATSKVLSLLEPAVSAQVVQHYSASEVSKILPLLSTEDAVGILEMLSPSFVGEIFSVITLPPGLVAQLICLFPNDERTANVLFTLKQKAEPALVAKIINLVPTEKVTPIISHLTVKVNSCLDMSDIGYAKLKDVLDQTGIVTGVNILQGQRPEVVMELMQTCMPLPQAVEMLQAMTSGMRLGVVMCAPAWFRERIREQVEAGRGSGSAVSCPNVCPNCSYHADSRHFQLLLQETPDDQLALLAGLDHSDLAKLFTAHLHEKEAMFVPPGANKSMADNTHEKPLSGKKGSKSHKTVSTQAFADVASWLNYLDDSSKDVGNNITCAEAIQVLTRMPVWFHEKILVKMAVINTCKSDRIEELMRERKVERCRGSTVTEMTRGVQMPELVCPKQRSTIQQESRLGTVSSDCFHVPKEFLDYLRVNSMRDLLKRWKRCDKSCITTNKLHAVIARIVQSKLMQDLTQFQSGSSLLPMSNFVIEYFDTVCTSKPYAHLGLLQFIFSLSEEYAKTVPDPLIALFTRILGLFDPVTAATSNIMVETVFLIASRMCAKNGGVFKQGFHSFFSQWAVSSGVPLPPDIQMEMLELIFKFSDNPEFGAERLHKQLVGSQTKKLSRQYSRKETHIRVGNASPASELKVHSGEGAVYLSDFVRFVLEKHVDFELNYRNQVIDAFESNTDDGMLTFMWFTYVVEKLEVHVAPSKTMCRLMFLRALQLDELQDGQAENGDLIVGQSQLFGKDKEESEDLLEKLGEDVTVSANTAAVVFLWHCGIMNTIAVFKGGGEKYGDNFELVEHLRWNMINHGSSRYDNVEWKHIKKRAEMVAASEDHVRETALKEDDSDTVNGGEDCAEVDDENKKPSMLMRAMSIKESRISRTEQ